MPTARPSKLLIVTAYATVYIIWGSTYFFIQKAVDEFPPAMMGAIRFLMAGIIMLLWVYFKGEYAFDRKTIIRAGIGGLLLLFVGNGIVMYVEQFISSAMVAIIVSATPIWFVLFDKPAWKTNLRSPGVILGTLIGFGGVVLLLSEQMPSRIEGTAVSWASIALLLLAPLSWALGSIYSKYNPGNASVSVTTAWQMIIAGMFFLLLAGSNGAIANFTFENVGSQAWLSLIYLIFFGSIAGFSAYVWLLQVEPTARAGTYAYVNPIVAVLMGMLLADENISSRQILGLAIILGSVLLINMQNYLRKPGRMIKQSAR